MFADYHVHTEFSDDSIYLMEDVIRDAVNMNMDEICITDHVDYGVKDDWDSGSEIIYRNGEPLANVDYPSYMDKIQFLKRKYAGKIRIKTGMEFGVQAHTIPQFEDLFTRYPFEKVKPIIEDILKIVIADGKGIEMNTSAKRYGLKDTMPSREILRLYRELGGEIITIGSDSHKPDQLGYGILEAQKILKDIGFQKICTFEKMNPVMHELWV